MNQQKALENNYACSSDSHLPEPCSRFGAIIGSWAANGLTNSIKAHHPENVRIQSKPPVLKRCLWKSCTYGFQWGIFLSHVWGHRRVAAWGYYWQDNEDHINDFFDEPQAGEENSRVGLKDGFLGWKNTHGLKKPWTFSGLIIMEYLGICLSTRYTPELQFEWENMWSFSASFIWDYPVFSQAGSDEYLNKPTHSYGGEDSASFRPKPKRSVAAGAWVATRCGALVVVWRRVGRELPWDHLKAGGFWSFLIHKSSEKPGWNSNNLALPNPDFSQAVLNWGVSGTLSIATIYGEVTFW